MGQICGNISINQSKQIKEIYQKQGQRMISKKSDRNQIDHKIAWVLGGGF